jgi:hypothetical protein
MGRIAYLSKRGRIWWFRRRHPAIIISQGQLPVFSGSYEDNRVTAQARGHLAVSLQTSSVREARLLAAKIAEHFERAWSKFETEITAMNDRPAQDLIDNMAHTLSEGFRKYITHYRTMNVATLTPEVRERVFATIDAELRQSLGIAPLPYDDMFKRTTPAPIQYISIKETPPEERTPEEQEYYAWEEKTRAEHLGVIENIIESENRKTSYLDVTESRLIDPDDEDGVERIEDFASGLGALLNDFITTCEKEGRNISQELPAARRIARSLYDSEPPRVYRRAKLSENCPLWNRIERRPRSRIHLSSANARCGLSRSIATNIEATRQRMPRSPANWAVRQTVFASGFVRPSVMAASGQAKPV